MKFSKWIFEEKQPILVKEKVFYDCFVMLSREQGRVSYQPQTVAGYP